ncbi:phosphatidylserine decarboxylase-domain-containing protein [Radiomyces spectabilis]|uniref:phosphatidylserine decarboxylase-domain-containing protein n=1 Tax=Radiomyces spectabilis TaxID=64574 RepID=UPI0022204C96|nr:phosphatidylserine decarboxylase-domain-containing protein [Radiomyces spectabilis]KAI8370475.1 phosphatidylserine decarboxylase-domain-containing protein [Radiomyces spectabilis]
MDSMNNVVSMHPLEDGTKDKTVILRKRRFRRRRRGHIAQFHSDVVGVTFLEISHANDLPPERNLTRTGFDMDPFVVISYGTSNFRTSAVRHNLNPVWNEKLYFHVHHNEVDYRLKLTVYDKDRFSGNDLVAWHEIPIMDIIKQSQAHQKKRQSTDEIPDNAIDQEMDRHTVPLTMLHKDKWKDRHPTLTFRAKFMPYDEIRRMFWIALARTYDVDGSGTLSRLEVQSMLETIGSTLSETTIDSFWRQHGQDPKNENDELPIENLVSSLEAHMLAANDHPATAPTSHTRRPTDTNDSACFKDTQFSSILSDVEENDHGPEDDEESDDDFRQDEEEEEQGEEDEQDDDDDAEDNSSDDEDDEETDWLNENSCGDSPDDQELFCSSDEVDDVDADDELILNEAKDVQYNGLLPVSFDTMGLSMSPTDTLKTWPMRKPSTAKRKSATEEKVIRIAECPICHRPNLSRRAQMDIVTHVATCAANDWTTVDRFLMGNFLTEAYAQRRWFVKLVSKVGYGKYSLGTNNANIIIQDRRTGQLIEERMSVYIRLGMRLVYKGLRTGIQSKTAQRILTNMTVRQGRRFDAPSSVREIPAFIKFHNISMDEVLEPLGNFKSFNDFFYRKLKPGSRPCDSPNDPSVAVSPADCRMLAFQTVNDATRLWIKGIEFSLAKLLDDPIGSRNFECGSLAIFRLAPQDYHRFHAPVDGTITDIKVVSGQYYTVNPMAIRTTLDVFGDNARTVIYMDTDRFGKVAVVCIGAMLVGSIIMTVKVGQHVNRTDEMGYFAFGGSTLVVIWERDKILLDKDLTSNSEKTLETLVRTIC